MAYLNLTRNSFDILFPAKGIMSCRQIISSSLHVRFKRAPVNELRWKRAPVNELRNFYVNHSKITKKHRGPHKMPSRATWYSRSTCLRPLSYTLLERVPQAASYEVNFEHMWCYCDVIEGKTWFWIPAVVTFQRTVQLKLCTLEKLSRYEKCQ